MRCTKAFSTETVDHIEYFYVFLKTQFVKIIFSILSFNNIIMAKLYSLYFFSFHFDAQIYKH